MKYGFRQPRRAVSKLAGFALLFIVGMGAIGGVALGVVGGKTISITAAPWAVVIWERSPYVGQPPYAACTGVVIGSRYVLTAGHCVMSGNSAKRLPASAFRIETGVSNFEDPLASDHPQSRTVSTLRVMPGYVAASQVTFKNALSDAAHDLAVLTLSQPLDLEGKGVRAAYLPTANTPKPSRTSQLVIAGFGNEKPTGNFTNGTLNEVVKPKVLKGCTTTEVLCVYSKTDTCSGDSGSGAIEPGRVPTVVGILSIDLDACYPGTAYFAYLTGPTIMRFIKTST